MTDNKDRPEIKETNINEKSQKRWFLAMIN